MVQWSTTVGYYQENSNKSRIIKEIDCHFRMLRWMLVCLFILSHLSMNIHQTSSQPRKTTKKKFKPDNGPLRTALWQTGASAPSDPIEEDQANQKRPPDVSSFTLAIARFMDCPEG